MKKTRRVSRPYVRRSRVQGGEAGQGSGLGAGRLAAMAGQGARPVIEKLEPRQLLFSLTITPSDVDPNTGLGLVKAFFGYTIPYLGANQDPGTGDVEQVDEDFNDEIGTGQLPNQQNIPNNQILNGSNLRVIHNINPASNFQVRAELDNTGQPTGERWVRARIDNGQYFGFQVLDATRNRIAAYTLAFTTRADGNSPTGLNTDAVIVQFFFDGSLVQSYTGAALRAQSSTGTGIGRFNFNLQPTAAGAFDEVRILGISGPQDAFQFDDLSVTIPPGNFTSIVTPRIFGAEVAFAGPVGASVQFLDLYGQEMRRTIRLGVTTGQVALVDVDDDGVPNYNDGIGKIVVSNATASTALTIFGGTISYATTASEDADFTESGFQFLRIENFTGLFDAFESAGFGFRYNTVDRTTTGLPPVGGSVIVGSPFLRPQNNYAPGGLAPDRITTTNGTFIDVTGGFTRPDQGIFVNGQRNIASVYVHGVVFGSSTFTGYVDRLAIGYPMGSFNVAGDLGTFVTATDAGLWVPDSSGGTATSDAYTKSTAQLIVGRTMGEIAIAGRSLLDVTIVGDINDPVNRPARDVFNYYEKEFIYGIATDQEQETVVRTTIDNTDYATLPSQRAFRTVDQAYVFGSVSLRNDVITGAEWVGSAATGVRISGDLSGRDPISNGDDNADVYGFAADGTKTVTIQADTSAGASAYFRVVDQDGRTITAVNRIRGIGAQQFLQFTPSYAGAYYLVITDPAANDDGVGTNNYVVTITGIESTTLGAYRVGASTGDNASPLTNNNGLTVLSGSVGSIRIGMGISGADGSAASPSAAINTAVSSDDDLMLFRGGTFSVPGNLYNITTGSDIEGASIDPVNFTVGGDFGNLVTGLSTVVGTGPTEGDVAGFQLFTGGRIAMIDIRGSIGVDQDATDPKSPMAAAGDDSVFFSTGRDTRQRGDIGMIRVGADVGYDSLRVDTPGGSIVGGLLISQDLPDDGSTRVGFFNSIRGARLNLGAGSDLRFTDFPEIDLLGTDNKSFDLIGGQVLTLIDDGGAQVQIRVLGVANGVRAGRVLALPVDGSQGVAIGRIEVDLSNGAALDITTVGTGSDDVVSIGRIIATNATATSRIGVKGTTQVDIWKIESDGPLDTIRNETPLGDIVAIDVQGLNSLTTFTGDIGQTQVPAWGPKKIGPFLGISNAGQAGSINGPLSLPPAGALMDDDWSGALYRGVNSATRDSGQASLDDIGSPFDPYLNGIVVRAGNLTSVTIGGALGDCIVSGGNLLVVRVNSDAITPAGRFDGIIGTLYGVTVQSVDVGDGLAANDGGPLLTTGIFAVNDIREVTATRIPGASIRSVIGAGDSVPNDAERDHDGIDTINVTGGGDYIGATIQSMNLDWFWLSFNYGDDARALGDIFLVAGNKADLFSCAISADNITTVQLVDGYWDATDLGATGNVGTVTATGYRNSTLAGTDREYRLNDMIIAGDLGTLTTTSTAGDIADLTVDINGSVTTEVSARDITRMSLDVDNQVNLIRTARDLRASQFTAGQFTRVTIGRNLQSSTLSSSGPILQINAADSIINTDIAVTGPDSRIETVTAKNLISGSISASGPITSVTTTSGDIKAAIITTTSRGNVATLSAARDLDVTTDISGTLNTLKAGRHIGNRTNPGDIIIRGDLQSATAGGQLYSDLRVGQSIIGTITIGPVSTLPGNNQLGSGSIIAFSRINAVAITGDFDGNIISYSNGIGTVNIFGGSFHPGRTIAAYSGSIDAVNVTYGDLMGDIHADYILYAVNVTASADGVFGDIGINPDKSSNTTYDQFRNQLPVGIAAGPAVNGPRISAGWNIGRVATTNGSMFEASIIAGRAIGFIDIRGSIGNDQFTPTIGTTIAAGDSIYAVGATGSMSLATIVAGVINLGADNALGGVGDNADINKSGWINDIFAAGGMNALVVSAGMLPGTDGLYNTADDRVAFGVSYINYINAPANQQQTAVSAFSDSFSLDLLGNSRVFKAGPTLQLEEPQIDPVFGQPGTPIGAGGLNFNWGFDSGTIYFAGPGEAFWDSVGGRVVVVNTSLASSVTIVSNTGKLTDFDVVSNDDASVGSLYIQASLYGDSDIVIDGYVQSITTGNVDGTGSWKIGGDVGAILTGNFIGGTMKANQVAYATIGGDFGASDYGIRGEVKIDFLACGFLAVGGATRGAIDIYRDITGFTSTGIMDGASLRAGASIGNFASGGLSRSWVAARDFFGAADVKGDMFDSSIMAGVDLGRDAEFDKNGITPPVLDRDSVTSGFLGNVSVAGNFLESDVIAGISRGKDGYFGTGDDSVAEGRARIGNVTITGTQTGSTRNSESYRIASTGTIGTVKLGGATTTGSIGNFAVEPTIYAPLVFQVEELKVTQDSQVYTARIFFDQAVNTSTVSAALAVFEVRTGGTIRLVEGVDYTVGYDSVNNAILVTFARAVTSRSLPQQSGVPGPGVYRFELDQSKLQAKLAQAKLDGNGDGVFAAGDNYSNDAVVGDAGDKITSQTITAPNGGPSTLKVDYYGPASLDVVLDDNSSPDGLPDVNKTVTIYGAIGDHPDHDPNYFRFSGDEDVYSITLQAGQILRLGAMQGPAKLASLTLAGSTGITVSPVSLPVNPADLTATSFDQTYLIKQTGTYYVAVTNTSDFFTNGVVPNPDAVPGGVGDYNFSITVFDDKDSGFHASTDSGNGASIVDAPPPSYFAGPDQVFGTTDDLTVAVLADYTFTLDRGPDNIPNTADDLVTGVNVAGDTTTTRNGANLLTTSIDSAIGPKGHSGLPNQVYPDVDVYHLNYGNPIAPGSKIRVTVQLNELGSDLGSRNQIQAGTGTRATTQAVDYRGQVQFGIFDTTGSTGIDDASLVISPTDFSPNGGTPNTVLGTSNNASYGFDANGDFYIEFLAPGRFGSSTQGASYAVYLQGVFNTDYKLQIVTNGAGVIQKTRQNVLIETNGGTVDWLQVADQVTKLGKFDAKILGFTGTVASGQDVGTYILSSIVTQLNAAFDAAGLDVTFSTNPADFEFQPFSTVYLTSTDDPVTNLFSSNTFSGLFSQFLGGNATSTEPYGFSQHSDPLNADKNDDAVVFLPSFATLGYTPSQSDIDRFTQSVSASVGRRVGELLGLRVSADNGIGSSTFDLFAADGPSVVPGSGNGYTVSNTFRALSDRTDSIERTDFFLGGQTARSLLDKVLSPG